MIMGVPHPGIGSPPASFTNQSAPMLQMQMLQQQPTIPQLPQLTGSLSLSLVEDGRLILRHNPNLQQDTQSQVILQAILSGALCNVTLINEPLIEKSTKLNNTTSTSSVSASRAIASTVSTTANKNVVVSKYLTPYLSNFLLFCWLKCMEDYI